jgi:hypothetical protein
VKPLYITAPVDPPNKNPVPNRPGDHQRQGALCACLHTLRQMRSIDSLWTRRRDADLVAQQFEPKNILRSPEASIGNEYAPRFWVFAVLLLVLQRKVAE